MDDENNGQMQSNDLEQQQQAMGQVAGDVAGKAANTAKKAASTAKDYATGKKKIVGPAKKARGKMYAAKGKAQAAAGKAMEAAGMATHAAGTATRGTAAALRAAGNALATVLDAAFGAGEAVRPIVEGVTKSIDAVGKGIQKAGKNIKKVGRLTREQGEHSIKRGKKLAETGKDIGARPGAIPGMPGSPKSPKIPSLSDFLKSLKTKAIKGVKGLMAANPILFFIILGIIALLIIVLIVVLIVSSSTDRGKYKEGDNSNVPYVVNQQAINGLKIVPNGSGGFTYGYVDENGNPLSLDETIDQILKTLKENGSNALEEMGDTDEERKAFLKLLIKAEIATQYPNLSDSVQVSSAPTISAGDYVVSTDQSNSAPVLNEDQLRQAVENSQLPDQGKTNVLGVIPDLIRLQEQYKVNAVFLIAAARKESRCGVDWDYIDPNTHNWLSVKGNDNGGYVDRNGTSWNTYSSYAEASEAWFKLISGSSSYFKDGKYSVKQIAPTYCDESWGGYVCTYMDELYKAVGISMNGSNSMTITTTESNTASSQWGWLIQNENINAYYYEHNYDNMSYDAYGVKGYITEDRQNYIVVSNSTGLYIGQGIQLYSNSEGWNTYNIEIFKNHGIDASGCKAGDTINANICDLVSQEIFENVKANIQNQAARNDLTLSENQIVALTDISYLNGNVNTQISNIYSLGVNNDALANTPGFSPVGENEVATTRAQNAWKLFKYGKYEARSGNPYKLEYFRHDISVPINPDDTQNNNSGDISGNSSSTRRKPNNNPESNDISGNIQIKRKDSAGKETYLKYVDEATFNSMITANDSNVMNYYTLKQGASAGTTGGTPSSLTGSESKEQIWNFLIDSGCTEEGVAAIMGNLLAESGCKSTCVQGDYLQSNPDQYDADYTAKVDNGEVSEHDFVNNGPGGSGYGLAQWTDPGRKQRLYTYAKSKGASIGDLQMQLEYLVTELSTNSYYSEIWTLMTTSNDMDRTCDMILMRFESPQDKERKIIERRGYASEIYNTYTGTHTAGSSSSSSSNNGGASNNSLSGSNNSTNGNSSSGSNSSFTSFDNFLFIGDSRYVGVSNELKALGNNVSVCAVSGSTCEQWVSVSENKSGNVKGTSINLPSSASGISVMLGVNSTSQTQELKQVFQNLHVAYPNARIYYNSAYHVGSNYTYANKDTVNANVDTFNGEIKTYCNSNSSWLQYVDVLDGIHDENGYLAYPDGEGIHLVDPGRAKLVENIRNNIKGGESSSNSESSSSNGIAKKGQKDINGVNITNSGNIDFLNCAIDAHALLREDKFTYNNCGRELPVVKGDSVHYVDCAVYVSMALESYGINDWDYYPHQLTDTTLATYGMSKFQVIYDGNASGISEISDIQSGDIIVMPGHTQIFYGFDDSGSPVWLNCGSNEAILRMEGTEKWDPKPILKVFRVPEGSGSYKGNSGNNDSSSNTGSNYMLTVASYTSRTTKKVTSYQYSYTDVISTNSGTKGSGSQFSATPGNSVSESTTYTYNATSLDYQTAMKDYTMYFDFLWAAFIASGDKSYIEELSKLVLNSNIEITIYSDEQVSQDSSTAADQPVTRSKLEGTTAYVDHYNATTTTTLTTRVVASKGGVTYADLWNMEYSNEAGSYGEFQSKSMEQLREKTEKDDEFVKIIKKGGSRLKNVYSELYLVERMVEENDRVKHVYPIYEYMVSKINKAKTEYSSLSELVDLNVFDLSSNEQSASSVQVLLYTSLNISDSDKELLYKAVEAICGPSCNDARRKKAVTSIILNRVLSSEFPNSIEGVLSQPGQFPNLNYNELSTYTPSDDTKSAVDSVIVGGDSSNRSVYVATPSQAESLGWDNSMKQVFNDGDGTDSSFSYYTTEEIEKELKQFETSIKGGTTVPSDTAKKIVEWAEAQVGKTSFTNPYSGGQVQSKNLCASFISAAYYQAGLEYLSVDAKDMPHQNPMKFNSDGSVNYADIPVGAVVVSQGSPVNGVLYGHVCLYVGNGYIIEAGGNQIVKSPINQSYGAGNCGPFVGWGFATSDQEDAKNKLVISIGGGGSYPQGYTKNDANTLNSTGVEGVFNSGTKTYNVYAQGANSVWGPKPYSMQTYAYSACGATSCAIIASAVDPNVTPEDTGKAIYAGLGLTYGSRNTAVTSHARLSKALDKYGIKHEWKYNATTQEVIAHLQSGNPVIVNIRNGTIGHEYYGGHYVTLLGIDSNGQIFLGDPARGGNNTAFYDQSQIFPLPQAGVCFINY